MIFCENGRYQIGKWQAAAFATIMPLPLDEILATLEEVSGR